MKPIDQIRREKLAELVAQAGSQAAVATSLGKDKNQIYQWLLDPTQPGARNIGSASARQIEACYGKPEGWLDQDASGQTQTEVSLASAISWLEEDAKDAFFRLSPTQKAKLLLHLCNKPSRPSKNEILALIALVT